MAENLPSSVLTLKASEQSRTTKIYEGVKITFLTGIYAGKSLHLGSNVYELNLSQSTSWQRNEEQGIRTGINFKNVSPRQISFTVDFYSFTEDISQLSENIAHLQELNPLRADSTTSEDGNDTTEENAAVQEGRTPPFVQIKAGKSIYNKVVCTNFNIREKVPHTQNQGFKYATVDLSFEVPGGKDSEYQNAIPFAPTPLGEEVRKQNLVERQEEAAVEVAEVLLDDCLGEEGSRQATDLIEAGGLGDIPSLLQLNDKLLVQLAIAGLPAPVYEDEVFKARLKEAIALELIRNESGFQNPSEYNHRGIAQGIINGNLSNIPPELLTPLANGETLFQSLVVDYNKILLAVQDQKLGSDDDIFNREENPTAADRLLIIGGCGLTLRQTNVLPNIDSSELEATILSNINSFLESDVSNEEIRRYFNLPDNTPETVLRKIRNSRPYSSQKEFLDNATYNQQGITGYGAWAGATQTEKNILGSINNFLGNEETTIQQIRERFKINEELAEAIKGKNFSNKQEFLDSLGNAGKEAWINSWRNH